METWGYILKRIIGSIPILFIVSLISFFLIRLSPIDPLAQLKLNPAISEETIQKEVLDSNIDTLVRTYLKTPIKREKFFAQ